MLVPFPVVDLLVEDTNIIGLSFFGILLEIDLVSCILQRIGYLGNVIDALRLQLQLDFGGIDGQIPLIASMINVNYVGLHPGY